MIFFVSKSIRVKSFILSPQKYIITLIFFLQYVYIIIIIYSVEMWTSPRVYYAHRLSARVDTRKSFPQNVEKFFKIFLDFFIQITFSTKMCKSLLKTQWKTAIIYMYYSINIKKGAFKK